ncbi:cytochrome P450 [Daldinia grandis]|nr:cytochrome P450 [Daldinia grandis]
MSPLDRDSLLAHLKILIASCNDNIAMNLLGLLLTIYLGYILALAIYRVWLHPLSRFPGPVLLSSFYFPYLYKSLVKGSWVRQMPALHQRYGPIVRIAPNHLAIDGAVAWPEVYAHRPNTKQEFGRPTGLLFPGDHLCILGAPREVHRRMRRQLSLAFSDGALSEQEATISRYVGMLLDKIEEHSQGGRYIDIVEWLNFTTFDVVGDLALGDSFHSLENNAYHPWVRLIFLGIRGTQFARFMGSYSFLRISLGIFSIGSIKARDSSRMAAVEKTIARMGQSAESEPGRRDFVAYMMQKTRSGEAGMSEQEILATTPILIIAGSETTGTALSGLLFHLSQNPFAYSALADEVRSAFRSEVDISFRSTASLEYLSACIDETLRVYPPATETLPRISPGDFVQDKYVPKGTRISVYPWATFRNPQHFSQPDTFSPQRWLSSSHPLYEAKFSGDNREVFKPFSFGTRDCLGKNLAYAEMRLITARLIYRFDYRIMPNQESWHDQQRMYLGWEKGPLHIQLHRRVDNARFGFHSRFQGTAIMGNSSSRVTAQDKAILDLKLQRDKLHQYQRRITVLTDKETAVARQMLAAGDKKRALLALRRKKYQESLLEKTDAQLAQLEQLTRSVEFALIQKDVVFGLQQGTRVLRDIHAEMGGLEHVEKLMGDTADAIAYQKEVSEMLGGRITNQDEDEVEDELAALEQEVNGPAKLPNVPDTKIPPPEVKITTPQEQDLEQEQEPEPERRAMLAA